MASVSDYIVQNSDSNAVLKEKFRKLHTTVVDNVNPFMVINVLFQEAVIGENDMEKLRQKTIVKEQCADLLTLLHTSQNPRAFVQLYRAIKDERHLTWLAEMIDNCDCSVEPTEILADQVVHTLAGGKAVDGVTTLDDKLYVLRGASAINHVEVYDVNSFSFLRSLTIPDVESLADMTSCGHYRCLYIADRGADCVHRLNLKGGVGKWPVDDKPYGISVNAAHNVLVTCQAVRKIKEFSSRGDLLRDVTLPDGIINPGHAIQLTSGQFIVCYGDYGDPVHGVAVISADGGEIVHSHAARPGSGTAHHKVPRHLAVDGNESVFVAYLANRRVVLLSQTLSYVSEVVTDDKLNQDPRRLCLDVERRRLYVADDTFKNGKWAKGRVVVFRV